ncbi:hypothetical protein FN846DRAFT_975919 [Sphaerosporella brunnea]|uniref:Uncharacterized protein n=1 Tax=Sphaerosporella brunnea TaxID=1250544 RepID=A0A5J5EGN7_9PEZI|nr:hypothetical protein FN846DRAFT_975919 [Sphaerosporella brunnea]
MVQGISMHGLLVMVHTWAISMIIYLSNAYVKHVSLLLFIVDLIPASYCTSSLEQWSAFDQITERTHLRGYHLIYDFSLCAGSSGILCCRD